MSTTAPISERTITAVLLALWRAGEARTDGGDPSTPQGVSVQQLLRETLAPLPDIQQALTILEQRHCLLDRGPPPHSTVGLLSIGLPCWRDVLEDFAKRHRLRIGRRVMVFGRIGSTSDMAWQCAANPDNDGLLVIADEQTAGRGRQGRTWHAKSGQSALFSIVLREMPPDSLDRLTLLAGLATARALERAACAAGGPLPPVEIKWPNDLFVRGRKIAGILVETRRGALAQGQATGTVVLGIGINIAQAGAASDNGTPGEAPFCGDFPDELRGRAISLYEAAGLVIDRMRVVSAVLEEVDSYLAKFARGETGEGWLEEWKARCPLLGQRIGAQTNGREVSGRVVDIDPLFGLVLRDDHGATHFLASQTSTLRS